MYPYVESEIERDSDAFVKKTTFLPFQLRFFGRNFLLFYAIERSADALNLPRKIVLVGSDCFSNIFLLMQELLLNQFCGLKHLKLVNPSLLCKWSKKLRKSCLCTS